MIFTRDDRAGQGKLSSRPGLVTDAVEVLQVVVGDVNQADTVGYEVLCRAHRRSRFSPPAGRGAGQEARRDRTKPFVGASESGGTPGNGMADARDLRTALLAHALTDSRRKAAVSEARKTASSSAMRR